MLQFEAMRSRLDKDGNALEMTMATVPVSTLEHETAITDPVNSNLLPPLLAMDLDILEEIIVCILESLSRF